MTTQLILQCRPGFESDCAGEIQAITHDLDVFGYCKSKPNTGYVQFFVTSTLTDDGWINRLSIDELIFARQLFICPTDVQTELDVEDRISGIKEVISQWGKTYGSVLLETTDTNEGRQLAVLAKKLQKPLEISLKKSGTLTATDPHTLHCLFTATDAAFIGYSITKNRSPFSSGVPRLKRPRNAPSRSTLKLDEAILYFGLESEIKPNSTAVDLGAAPGGWTWQLVRRNIHVIAIDNGDMAPELKKSPLVEHYKEDGFKYKPPYKIDWLVCDMVEKPHRIATLMTDWLRKGHAKAAIFNLKLPMKKRWQAVDEILLEISQALSKYDPLVIRAKHLYHNREEITVYIKTS